MRRQRGGKEEKCAFVPHFSDARHNKMGLSSQKLVFFGQLEEFGMGSFCRYRPPGGEFNKQIRLYLFILLRKYLMSCLRIYSAVLFDTGNLSPAEL